MENLLEIERQKVKVLTEQLNLKNNQILLLIEQSRPAKNIKESMKRLIDKYNLVPGSEYFRREAACRIMVDAVKQCKALDDKWKNIKDPEIEELVKINSGEIKDFYNSKVYLKLLDDYTSIHGDPTQRTHR